MSFCRRYQSEQGGLIVGDSHVDLGWVQRGFKGQFQKNRAQNRAERWGMKTAPYFLMNTPVSRERTGNNTLDNSK